MGFPACFPRASCATGLISICQRLMGKPVLLPTRTVIHYRVPVVLFFKTSRYTCKRSLNGTFCIWQIVIYAKVGIGSSSDWNYNINVKCRMCIKVHTTMVMWAKLPVSMLTLFESRYTLKGRYNIGNVGKTASTSMLTLFESRYTLKGRYSIVGNVGKTASTSMLTLFESRYTLKGMFNIVGNVGKTASTSMLTLFESRYTLFVKGRYNIGNVGQTAKLLLRVCLLSLNQDIHCSKGRYNVGNVGQTASTSMLTLFESRYK